MLLARASRRNLIKALLKGHAPWLAADVAMYVECVDVCVCLYVCMDKRTDSYVKSAYPTYRMYIKKESYPVLTVLTPADRNTLDTGTAKTTRVPYPPKLHEHRCLTLESTMYNFFVRDSTVLPG